MEGKKPKIVFYNVIISLCLLTPADGHKVPRRFSIVISFLFPRKRQLYPELKKSDLRLYEVVLLALNKHV